MSTRRRSSSRGSNADKEADKPFEVKHRIAGAVVLMLVAVVVIPLLLTDPGVEANSSGADNNRVGGREFQSRIVPLNINNANSGDQTADETSTVVNVGNATVVDDDRPALLDLTGSGDAEVEPADEPVLAAIAESVQDSADQSAAEPETVAARDTASEDKPAEDQPEAAVESVVMTAAAEPEPKKSTTESAKQPESAAKSALEVAAIDDEQVVKQGWVVRVGTFSKSANVESVSTLLTSSGFKPRMTPVATSLGQSTRVWLGPYAKRETADKISTKLKTLTGEKGYVTKTSS